MKTYIIEYTIRGEVKITTDLPVEDEAIRQIGDGNLGDIENIEVDNVSDIEEENQD